MFEETPEAKARRREMQQFYQSNQSDFERIAKQLNVRISEDSASIDYTDLNKMWKGIQEKG